MAHSPHRDHTRWTVFMTGMIGSTITRCGAAHGVRQGSDVCHLPPAVCRVAGMVRRLVLLKALEDLEA